MNYTKQNPVGIDVPIKRIQDALYEKLNTSWKDIVGYGRVYKTVKGERVIPEHYIGEGEYKEVLTDDKKTAIFFFIESSTIRSMGGCLSKNSVDLIFLVNVLKAKPEAMDYADEEVRLEVLKIAQLYFTSISETIKGREALKGFTTENLDFIHPYFIFKISGIINNY